MAEAPSLREPADAKALSGGRALRAHPGLAIPAGHRPRRAPRRRPDREGPMRAVRVPAFGGPEVLELVDVEEAAPAAGQVVIEVKACGLNWSDLLQRQGQYPGGPRPP